jgi:hypothetical protein
MAWLHGTSAAWVLSWAQHAIWRAPTLQACWRQHAITTRHASEPSHAGSQPALTCFCAAAQQLGQHISQCSAHRRRHAALAIASSRGFEPSLHDKTQRV